MLYFVEEHVKTFIEEHKKIKLLKGEFLNGNFVQTLQEILISNSENDMYDLFRACDPIHPPLKEGGKPILYINRMEAFANELDIEFQLRNSIKQYYDVR